MDYPNPAIYPTGKDLETAIQNGIKSGCFYSYILSSIDRRIDETSEAVAYVSLPPQRGEWTLAVNPILFAEIMEAHPECDRERVLRAILIHEFLHIARDHFERGFALQERYSLTELNVAADLAVNCTLNSLDKNLLKEIGGLLPDQPPFKLSEGLSMEQYLALLSGASFTGRILDPKLSGYEKTMKEIQGIFADLPQKSGSNNASQKTWKLSLRKNLKRGLESS